jgi:hypothetical protein
VADNTAYLPVDLSVIHEVGQRAAVVLAILSEGCDKDGWVCMTHAEVAAKAGIPNIGARRAINELRHAGLLKSEEQYRNNRQRANLYQVPPRGHSVPPAHTEQANYIDTTTTTISHSSLHKKNENQEVKVVPVPAIPQASGALRAPCGSGTSQTEGQLPASGRSQVVDGENEIWPSPDSEMPVRRSGWFRNIFEIDRETRWLTVTFERMVLDHEALYRRALGRERRETVGDSRKRKFLKASRAWLGELHAPPLADICEVARQVFEDCDGYFPFEAINPWSGKVDEKLTSILQLHCYYEHLLEWMQMRGDTKPATHNPAAPEAPVNAPPGDVHVVVDEMVELFVKFRGRTASDSLRRNCADTFRIMLTRDKIDAADIRKVLKNLAWVGKQGRIDARSYQDTAFPLRRDFRLVHRRVTEAIEQCEQTASGLAQLTDL